MKANTYLLGKLPMADLAELLARHGSRDARVLAGVSIGQDATVIDLGDRYLVAKTDPITFAADQIGWYAVQVNANDLACSGVQPLWFLCTILLPEDATDRTLVDSIFGQIGEACRSVGASLVGGHTEITAGLKRPIIVGQMLGEVAKDKLVKTSGARAGDAILLTKAVAIEGTALIAREKAKDLRNHGFDDAFLAEAQGLLYTPGISVLREALLATAAAPVHAMHDPTEGGVGMGLVELARASHLGLVVDASRIPILPACRRLCEHYHLHPLCLLASGSMLITVAPQDADKVCTTLAAEGIQCTLIGHMLPEAEGCKIRAFGTVRELPCRERDEITRIL